MKEIIEAIGIEQLKDETLGLIGTPRRDAFEKEVQEELFKIYKFYQKYVSKYIFNEKGKRIVKGTRVYKKIIKRLEFIDNYQDKYIKLEF